MHTKESIANSSVSESQGQKVQLIARGSNMINDLCITHAGGGHEMVDSGDDPSWINLELSTPRKKKTLHRNIFAKSEGDPDADIIFDNYVIRVVQVEFDGASALLSVQKKGGL